MLPLLLAAITATACGFGFFGFGLVGLLLAPLCGSVGMLAAGNLRR